MPKIKTKKVLRRSKENLRHFNKSEIADRELEETEKHLLKNAKPKMIEVFKKSNLTGAMRGLIIIIA